MESFESLHSEGDVDISTRANSLDKNRRVPFFTRHRHTSGDNEGRRLGRQYDPPQNTFLPIRSPLSGSSMEEVKRCQNTQTGKSTKPWRLKMRARDVTFDSSEDYFDKVLQPTIETSSSLATEAACANRPDNFPFPLFETPQSHSFEGKSWSPPDTPRPSSFDVAPEAIPFDVLLPLLSD